MTIKEKAEALIEHYGTRNPFTLAKALGVALYYQPLGELEGFYTIVLKRRAVVLNNELEEARARLILAHELGHDQLHRHERKKASEFMALHQYQDATNQYEIEANTFAAHLLIDDEVLKTLLKEGYSLEEAGKILEVGFDLIALKARELAKTEPFSVPFFAKTSNFL